MLSLQKQVKRNEGGCTAMSFTETLAFGNLRKTDNSIVDETVNEKLIGACRESHKYGENPSSNGTR
jgi:hypothetical protein